MNKTMVSTWMAGAGLALASIGSALADSPQFGTAAPAASATSDQAKAAEDHERAVRSCIRDTGSHMADVRRQCEAQNGTSYDKSDIDSTGATNLGDAMQQLDPRLTVNRR